MKILITGATGFVGKTLIPYLFDRGITDIAILVRNKEKALNLFPLIPVTIFEIDNNMRESVISYSPDVVLHMAALFNSRDDANTAKKIIDSNIVFGTLLLEAVSKTSCHYFINLGTFTEYLYGAGEFFPNNLYSASKTAFRSIVQYYQTVNNVKWINVIVYSPYGRKNDQKKVVDYMLDAMDSSILIDFSKGEQILDFIHVDDIASFFYCLFTQIHVCTDNFTQFHLGTGDGHSIREVSHILEKVFSKKINANWGGLPYRPLDIMFAVAPIARNIELLNWKAQISLEQGFSILKEDMVEKLNS
jgi:CDP-paratose synthetase